MSGAPTGKKPASHNIMLHLDGGLELRPFKENELYSTHLRVCEEPVPRARGAYSADDPNWAKGVEARTYKMVPGTVAGTDYYFAFFVEVAP